MQKGYLYFISDQYYEKYTKDVFTGNKAEIDDEPHNRPCYYAFKDDQNDQIFWMVPVSSKVEKYEKLRDHIKKRYGVCDKISFGYVKGEKNAFLLQDMIPVTEKYILNQYYHADTKTPITISKKVKKEINAKARKILRLADRGKYITFTDILTIREKLIEEVENKKLETAETKPANDTKTEEPCE